MDTLQWAVCARASSPQSAEPSALSHETRTPVPAALFYQVNDTARGQTEDKAVMSGDSFGQHSECHGQPLVTKERSSPVSAIHQPSSENTVPFCGREVMRLSAPRSNLQQPALPHSSRPRPGAWRTAAFLTVLGRWRGLLGITLPLTFTTQPLLLVGPGGVWRRIPNTTHHPSLATSRSPFGKVRSSI